MPKLYLHDLKPGMKLLKPVTNSSGVVLLAGGTELNEELIGRLQRMEVESVYVRGESRLDRPLEELLAELDSRFKKTENEPQMATLKRLIQEHLAALYASHGL
ncbi:MAG: hypothetical protein HY892_06325 [Deltaproteobacteria bacterium]|nr:hypothetical protein [Deltaproteobacteria bacterium]